MYTSLSLSLAIYPPTPADARGARQGIILLTLVAAAAAAPAAAAVVVVLQRHGVFPLGGDFFEVV